MLYFLLTFIILLLVSSFFIVSFYHLSRHWTEIQPNNKVITKGHIFRFWSMFWEQQKGTAIVYYADEALKNKYKELEKLFPAIAHKFHLGFTDKSFVLNQNETFSKQDKDNFEKLIGCQYEVNADAYFLFIEEPVYLFHEWIRKPVSSCPTCMASVLGTIIYFTSLHLNHKLFLWSIHPIQSIFLFYVVFIVILSLLNSIFYRKTFEFV